MSETKREYRVRYKREGIHRVKLAKYATLRAAERFMVLLGPEPWLALGKQPNDPACCKEPGLECSCEGMTIREHNDKARAEMPPPTEFQTADEAIAALPQIEAALPAGSAPYRRGSAPRDAWVEAGELHAQMISYGIRFHCPRADVHAERFSQEAAERGLYVSGVDAVGTLDNVGDAWVYLVWEKEKP